MTSMFDYDNSVNLAFDAKIAGKSLVAAKHELLNKTGDFFFLAHSDKELAYRMQMVEADIEKVAHRKLANVSDSKAKLVRAVFDEWELRHASCQMCKQAGTLSNKLAMPLDYEEPRTDVVHDEDRGTMRSVPVPGHSLTSGTCDGCGERVGIGRNNPAFVQDTSPTTMVDTDKADREKIRNLPKGTAVYCAGCAANKLRLRGN